MSEVTPEPAPSTTKASEVAPPNPQVALAPAPAEAKPQEPAKVADPSPEKLAVVVPEKYDLKLADGSFLDASAVEKIAVFAKQQGLSNADAQAVLDQQQADVADYMQGKKQEWMNKSMQDKEIGGENLKKNIETAHRFVERFGSPELKNELNKTGYGNHPELVRMLVRAVKSMNEDQFVSPGAMTEPPKSIADILYGKNDEAKP